MKTLNVKLPAYVVRFLERQAERCGVTVEQMAAYFFAREVVHA